MVTLRKNIFLESIGYILITYDFSRRIRIVETNEIEMMHELAKVGELIIGEVIQWAPFSYLRRVNQK